MKKILFLICLLPLMANAQQGFVRCTGGQLTIDGQPYYYVGTNTWYLPQLASTGEGGDSLRLQRELDKLCKLGIKNLRILVGADGIPTARKVRPILQPRPGEYDQTLLQALDRALGELRKRGMKAVLYLNNSWSWSGGYASYLRWANGDATEHIDSMAWPQWCRYAAQFSQNRRAQELFFDHVRAIVSRTNSLTHQPYSADPTIMAWQIGNEPRAFSAESKEPLARWVAETAALIKQLDPNHLVSVGSEGSMGCEEDFNLYTRLHTDPNIDYLTIHIWPQNWSWVKRGEVATAKQKDLMRSQLDNVMRHTEDYIRMHAALGRDLHKPLVIEEFGYPRDGNQYSHTSTTRARDAYYRFILDHLVQSRELGDVLCGINFWGWNGEARNEHIWWQPGDPYMADPAQEEQGLYGVFDSDRTVKVLKRAARQLR
ncbi:MAG: cellulase family glycosylhydrolase [Bacteroidaceae bacterium]|nr:cellulase family glycosylhydrolase [Bacteroidaceae bacterium]